MKTTERGFSIHEFEDHYGSKCSLQKSSLATEDCIWFGVTEPFDDTKIKHQTRMHLTRKMVKELLPILRSFVKTGEIDN